MELFHRGEAHRGRADLTVERGLLVWVFSVAQREGPLGLEPQRGREQLVASGRVRPARPRPRQIARDRGVVLGGPAEGLLSQPEASRVAQRAAARPELVEDRAVLGFRGDDGHARVVLRGGTDHRRSPDVDLLDRLGLRHARPRHGLLERIEGDDDQIDRRDPVLRERGEMLGDVSAGENPAVDLRVQGLDPPVEHLGESGGVRHIDHPYPRLAEELRGASGRKDLDAERGKGLSELADAGLVVNADEGSANSHRMVTLRPTTTSRPSANRRTASG